MTASSIFLQIHKYIIKFHCLNKAVFSGLLKLAAFSKANDDLYDWFGSFVKLCPASRWMCVTVHCLTSHFSF